MLGRLEGSSDSPSSARSSGVFCVYLLRVLGNLEDHPRTSPRPGLVGPLPNGNSFMPCKWWVGDPNYLRLILGSPPPPSHGPNLATLTALSLWQSHLQVPVKLSHCRDALRLVDFIGVVVKPPPMPTKAP